MFISLIIVLLIALSQVLAFTFGRVFKGWLGFMQDIIVWTVSAIFVLPPVLLTNGQSTIAVFAWFISWVGAYSIGNIDKAPKGSVPTKLRIFATKYLFPIWLVVWTIIIIWLASTNE